MHEFLYFGRSTDGLVPCIYWAGVQQMAFEFGLQSGSTTRICVANTEAIGLSEPGSALASTLCQVCTEGVG